MEEGIAMLVIVLAGLAIPALLYLPFTTADAKVISQCKEKGYYYYNSETKMTCSIEQ